MEDIGKVYARRRSDYVRVSTAILGDVESASDAVHEAFVSAIRRRRGFRADGPLEGWIWTIVVNTARDHSRRVRLHELCIEPGECATPHMRIGSGPESATDHAALHGQITQLPERQRLILFLRFYADFDYGQIARLLNISTGTVGATLHSALRTLDPAHLNR